MKKLIRSGLLLLAIVIGIESNAASNDVIVVDRILISNSRATVALNPLLPGTNVESVSTEDDIIYYVANIGIINPTKKNMM